MTKDKIELGENEIKELLEKKELDEKKKRVENLLRNYKTNQARLKILELNLVSDQDNILNGIDYSREVVQTSNIRDISDMMVAREKEMSNLTRDIGIAEALLDSLNEKDRFLVWNFYIERRTKIQIANDMNYYEIKSVSNNKDRIIKSLMELI